MPGGGGRRDQPVQNQPPRTIFYFFQNPMTQVTQWVHCILKRTMLVSAALWNKDILYP